MRRAIVRSIVVAVGTLAVCGAVAFGYFSEFCARHLAWRRVVEKQSTVVLETGFGIARPGDALFVCATPHCFGPFGCHDDLKCICAPATLDVSQVAGLVFGSCVLDHARPSRQDETGACRYAHCDNHLTP